MEMPAILSLNSNTKGHITSKTLKGEHQEALIFSVHIKM